MAENMKPASSDVENLKVNEKKWSKTLMQAGWSAIPNVLIEKQAALGLDPIDMNIIVHLAHYWWRPENLPHPSVETIATAIGLKKRAVQTRIKALEAHGLITRVERRHTPHGSMTNLYSFTGLIEHATPYAKEKIAEIEKATAAKKERLARKRPKLVVDND